jgi:hypothetical protein
LLNRCHTSYGVHKSSSFESNGHGPQNLRRLAGVFEHALVNEKLCVVGSISTDRNTLQESSCRILERSIKNMAEILLKAFKQGRYGNGLTLIPGLITR